MRRILFLILYIGVLLLFSGSFLNLPVALFIVAGKSMEPTLKVGDLVLAVDREPEVGDIVGICGDELKLKRCTVHRLVGYRDGEPITKGDNNPAPDPAGLGEIRYKVVLRIPREVWIPIALLVVASTIAPSILYSVLRDPFYLSVGVSFLLLGFYVLLAGASNPGPIFESDLSIPAVFLNRASLSDDYRTILVEVRSEGTEIASIEECYITFNGDKLRSIEPRVESSTTLVVAIQDSLWRAIYRELNLYGNLMTLNCTLNTNYGTLDTSIPFLVTLKQLEIEVDGGSVAITNANPFPVRTYYVLKCLGSEGVEFSLEGNVTIEARGAVTIFEKDECNAYVAIEYEVGGVKIIDTAKSR